MAEQLFIVTGASRGMGAAIAEQLLRPGHLVLCISRRTSETLAARAKAAGLSLEQWPQDLAQAVEAAARLEAWLRQLDGKRFAAATLINNAGVVTDPGPADEADLGALSNAIRVGLEAPLLLAASFLRATARWPAAAKGGRRVLNISSGLGRRAMAGSAAYCAAKAGMDHFSRALAMEAEQAAAGAKIVSLAPGVIDTDMQVQLRAADPAKFPDHHRFVGFKTGGQLASPAEAAAKVLAYLNRADFGSNPVADVRDA
jgi:benzil reductase ((S)-benzoin forming)